MQWSHTTQWILHQNFKEINYVTFLECCVTLPVNPITAVISTPHMWKRTWALFTTMDWREVWNLWLLHLWHLLYYFCNGITENKGCQWWKLLPWTISKHSTYDITLYLQILSVRYGKKVVFSNEGQVIVGFSDNTQTFTVLLVFVFLPVIKTRQETSV